MDISQELEVEEVKCQPAQSFPSKPKPIPPPKPKPKNVPLPDSKTKATTGTQVNFLKKSTNVAKLVGTIEHSLHNSTSANPVLTPGLLNKTKAPPTPEFQVQIPEPFESPPPIFFQKEIESFAPFIVNPLQSPLSTSIPTAASENNKKAPPKPPRPSIKNQKTVIRAEEGINQEEKDLLRKVDIQETTPLITPNRTPTPISTPVPAPKIIKPKPRIAPKPVVNAKNQSVSFAPTIDSSPNISGQDSDNNNTDTDYDTYTLRRTPKRNNNYKSEDNDKDNDEEDCANPKRKEASDIRRSRAGILKSRNNSFRSHSVPFSYTAAGKNVLTTKNERFLLLNNKYNNSKYNSSVNNNKYRHPICNLENDRDNNSNNTKNIFRNTYNNNISSDNSQVILKENLINGTSGGGIRSGNGWRKPKAIPRTPSFSIPARFQALAQVQLQEPLRPFGNLKTDPDFVKPSLIKATETKHSHDNDSDDHNIEDKTKSIPPSFLEITCTPPTTTTNFVKSPIKSKAPAIPSPPVPPPRLKRRSIIDFADVQTASLLLKYNEKSPLFQNNHHNNSTNKTDNSSDSSSKKLNTENSNVNNTNDDDDNNNNDDNDNSSNNSDNRINNNNLFQPFNSSNKINSTSNSGCNKTSISRNNSLRQQSHESSAGIRKYSPHYAKVNKCKRWPSRRSAAAASKYFKNTANSEKTSLLAENVIPLILDKANNNNNNCNNVNQNINELFVYRSSSFRLNNNNNNNNNNSFGGESMASFDGVKKLELLPETDEMAVVPFPNDESTHISSSPCVSDNEQTSPPQSLYRNGEDDDEKEDEEGKQNIFAIDTQGSSSPVNLIELSQSEDEGEENTEGHNNVDSTFDINNERASNERVESTTPTLFSDNNAPEDEPEGNDEKAEEEKEKVSLSPSHDNEKQQENEIDEITDDTTLNVEAKFQSKNTNDCCDKIHASADCKKTSENKSDRINNQNEVKRSLNSGNTSETSENEYDRMVDIPLVLISDCDEKTINDYDYESSSPLIQRKDDDDDDGNGGNHKQDDDDKDEEEEEVEEEEIKVHETRKNDDSLMTQINQMLQNDEDWYSDDNNKNCSRKRDDDTASVKSGEDNHHYSKRSIFRPRSRSQSRSKSRERFGGQDDELMKSPQTKKKNSTSLLDLVDIEIQKVQSLLADITTPNKRKSIDGGCGGIYRKHNSVKNNNTNNNNNNHYHTSSKNLTTDQPKSVLLRKSSVPELRVTLSEFKMDDEQNPQQQKLIRHSWATKSTSSVGSTTSSSSLGSMSQSTKSNVGSTTPGKIRRKSDLSQWLWIDEGEMSGAGGDIENSPLHSSNEEIGYLENSGRPLFRRRRTVADFFGKARKTSMASIATASMIWKQNVKKKSTFNLHQQQIQNEFGNEVPQIQVMFAENGYSDNRKESNNNPNKNTTFDEDEEEELELIEFKRKTEAEMYDRIMIGLPPKAKKAFYVVREILTSEKTFVDVLHLITIDFPRSLAKTCQRLKITHDFISDPDLEYILGGLPILKGVNEDILHDLEDRVSNWSESSKISDIFVKKGAFLKHYTNYIKDFEKISKFFDCYCEKNSQFANAVRHFEMSKRCQNLILKSYMLKPVQRMPQYGLLLEDYLRNLEPEHPDYDDSIKAIAIVRNVAEHANEAIRIQNVMERLLLLQERLPSKDILGSNKTLLKEGELMKVCRKDVQPRYFALMNDCLLCMAYNTTSSLNNPNLKDLKIKYELPLTRMKVMSTPSQESQNEFSIIGVARSFIVVAKSAKEREEWMDALKSAINEHSKSVRSSQAPVVDIDLQQYQLGKQAPVWISDSRASMCQLCNHEFNMVFRRHHCRSCGSVVCRRCSNNESPLEYLNFNTARVCDICYDILLEECEQRHSEDPIKFNQRRLKFKKFNVNVSQAQPNKRSTKSHKKIVRLPSRPQVKDGDSSPKLSGYLSWKEKVWKRNWFVLVDCVLYIFQRSEDTDCLQTIPILGYIIEPGDEGAQADVTFKLKHKGRGTITFQAENPLLAKKWISILEEATALCSIP